MMFPKRIFGKIVKDFWRIKYRTMAIILTIAISVAIHTGTHTSLQSINETCARLYREMHLSDLQFNFIPATEDELPCRPHERIAGIERLEKRLILPGSIEAKNDELIATLLVVLDEEKEPQVNSLKIMKGSYFQGKDCHCVLLDYTFARERGYKVGDKITLGVQGFFSELTVSGLVVNAEHLLTAANPDYYMPVKNSLGIAYIPMGMIKELFGYRIYNNFSLTCSRGADIRDIRRAFSQLLTRHGLALDSVLLQSDLFSVKVIERDMRSFFMVLPAIVGIFILVSFLILFFSLSRMIQQEMTQLGTLLACGFNSFQLVSAYLGAAALLGLIGYLIGCAGSNFMADINVTSYASGTGLPLVFRYYNGKSFLIAFLFSLGAPMIAAGFSLMQIRRLSIAEMLGRTMEKPWSFRRKTKADTTGPVPVTCQGNPVLERGSILKMGMRNLWRRKLFFLLSAFSIVLGIALAESLLTANVSIYRTIDDFFRLEKWDLFIPFTGLVEGQRIDRIKQIQGISRVSPFRKELVTLHIGRKREPYQLVGIAGEHSLIRPDIIEGGFFSSNDAREIILNMEMRDKYGLKVGDQVEVWAGNRRKANCKLVGIMNNFTLGQAFVPAGFAQDISENRDRFAGVFLALDLPFEKIRSSLQKLDFVGYIVRKDDARKTFHINMKKISTFIHTYSLLSLVLSICIIFVNLYLNTIYRKSEYAVLLANGFGQREIGLMIFWEVLAIVIIVITAAIPISILIIKFFCCKIAQASIVLHLQIRLVDYLKIFIPMIVLMAGVAWYCIRYASSIDITGTMRNRINE
ncbi:MAG: ABC transporter permease [bacterium]